MTNDEWKRAGELAPNPVLFNERITPESVIQGNYFGNGNCYFMSALAGLARFPNRIIRLFPMTQINPNGIYIVKLFHKGVFKEIIVDDYVPSKSGKPLFAPFINN